MTIKAAAKKKAPVKKAKPKLEGRHYKWLKDNLNQNDASIKWLIEMFGEDRILKTFYEERDDWTDEMILESSLSDSENMDGESLPFNCGVYVAHAGDISSSEDIMQMLLYAAPSYRHVIVTTNHQQKKQFKLLKKNKFEVIRGYMGNPNHNNATQIAVLMYTFPTTAN